MRFTRSAGACDEHEPAGQLRDIVERPLLFFRQLPRIHKNKFSLLFLHLLDDISEWRKNIFILQEANDVHYLDSSLLSSCLQIQSIFEKKDVAQDDEDDFELF